MRKLAMTKSDKDILHVDGDFRLYRINGNKSYIAHRCYMYPSPAKTVWWYMYKPTEERICFMCGLGPSDDIMGLYVLHNWDR